jgi:hypothetical protein
MRIEVTQEDIDSGVQADCAHCPVAKAIKRTIQRRDVYVEEKYCFVGDCRIELPNKVSDFIFDFDNRRRRVAPFAFELES